MSTHICCLAPPKTLAIENEETVFPINRIFCVGRNYAAHAAEMGNEVDKQTPFYFTVSPINASNGGQVNYPDGTDDYHHEIEFVVALDAPAHHIAQEKALDVVFGYGVGLDMTRRDLQAAAKEKRRPWDLAKDAEESAIFSALVKKDAFGEIRRQAISLEVNGEMRQHSTLDKMVNSVPELIAHLSQFYHLMPGDIIMTGTPEGVASVKRGDKLIGKVEGCPSVMAEFI